MQYITLLTDFGLTDSYVGIMKGVIYRIASPVQITDITHSISPQNVLEGSLVLKRAYRYFPEDSIHVAVVDPGVGTHRRPLAAKIGSHYFVCPDNGLLTAVLEEAEQAGLPVHLVHLDQPRYWLSKVSNVFHGRDIFAPAAAHLATGVPLEALGSPVTDPQRLDIPQPQPIEGGWRGQIIQIDHFGNLEANFSGDDLQKMGPVQVQIAGITLPGLVHTFGEGRPGELVAMIDSSDFLSICVVNGSAAQHLNVGLGEPVIVKR
jgi:S-adenosylmethionine hydrolase